MPPSRQGPGEATDGDEGAEGSEGAEAGDGLCPGRAAERPSGDGRGRGGAAEGPRRIEEAEGGEGRLAVDSGMVEPARVVLALRASCVQSLK